MTEGTGTAAYLPAIKVVEACERTIADHLLEKNALRERLLLLSLHRTWPLPPRRTGVLSASDKDLLAVFHHSNNYRLGLIKTLAEAARDRMPAAKMYVSGPRDGTTVAETITYS